jgi:D-alanyl-D-alanine carboxypeptidase
VLPTAHAVGSVAGMSLRTWIRTGIATAVAGAMLTVSGVASAATTTPAGHPYRQEDLQRDLDAITATGVPGVLADVHLGAARLRGTSGVADLDTRAPIAANGFFRIGSNTKTFIAVVALQLVEEHRLSLDDPVERWLPGVVRGNGNDGTGITVRELLQHTSGLHNYTDDLQERITSVDAYRELEFHRFSRQDLLDIALAHQPDFAPGTGWNYSNTNYVLLGMVIEKATGHTWPYEVTRRIIAPLGLRHTYAPGDTTRLPQPHATGYLFFDRDTRVDTSAENMSWADAAGALVSTADDLSRFWNAIGRGTLLRPAQVRLMRQTVPADGGDAASVPGSRYGLGIFFIPLTCGGGYWSHEGDVPGYNTVSGVSADGRTTVVLSVNSNVDDPILAAEYGLVDHVMCAR